MSTIGATASIDRGSRAAAAGAPRLRCEIGVVGLLFTAVGSIIRVGPALRRAACVDDRRAGVISYLGSFSTSSKSSVLGLDGPTNTLPFGWDVFVMAAATGARLPGRAADTLGPL